MSFSTLPTEGKNPNISVSQARTKLRACITILGFFFLNPMNSGKTVFLNFKGIQKVLTKTIP